MNTMFRPHEGPTWEDFLHKFINFINILACPWPGTRKPFCLYDNERASAPLIAVPCPPADLLPTSATIPCRCPQSHCDMPLPLPLLANLWPWIL